MWPLVGVVMGSKFDWHTMRHAAITLDALGVPFEVRVVSAHRTPDLLFGYAEAAKGRGMEVVIAGAGGAAHLPGMLAAKTLLPVIGVPVKAGAMMGFDALLSIAQMPGGVPVGTMAIGQAGAVNAALFAAAILAGKHPGVGERLAAHRTEQSRRVVEDADLATLLQMERESPKWAKSPDYSS